VIDKVHPASSEAPYYPALDGLRAAAAISVVLGHFAPKHVAGLVAYGDAGVIVFFVLSGFLITNILLRERERSGFQLKAAAKTFYLRRSLRIFPLYYAAIAICIILGEPHVWQKWFSLLTFNLPGIPPVMADYGSLAHFWSLFVEEQFYLVWPLLIWKAPRPWLLPLLIVIPVVSLTLKHGAALAGLDYRWVFSSVLCCADHLGAGALLAYVMRYHPSRVPVRSIWLVILALIPAGIFSFVRLSQNIDGWYSGHLWFGCFMHSMWTLAGVALVAALLNPPRVLAWLAWRPLRFLGSISYGIYVYHFMVPFLQDRFSLGHFSSAWAECAYRSVLTLTLAVTSWHLLESPFLSLKARLAPSGRSGKDTFMGEKCVAVSTL
jgi:peptidoglycan/LPS O-acetylase OafA/YrhL